MASFQITCVNGTNGPPWPGTPVACPEPMFRVGGTWPQREYTSLPYVKCIVTINGRDCPGPPQAVASNGTWSTPVPSQPPPAGTGTLMAYLLANATDPITSALQHDGPVSVQVYSGAPLGTC